MITLFSPAKINLFFRVLKKREDGFHEIASLYQALSLGDDIVVTPAQQDSLTCDIEGVPLDASNLVLKAAALFRQKTALPIYAHFDLNKRIPLQAGLGGGSSNAATALWALNELAGRPASIQDLQQWGGELGSDVAFFLSLGTAYCRGRGEIIEECSSLPGSCWIAKPRAFALSTPLVYKHCRPELFQKRDAAAALASFYTSDPLFFNDLEVPSFQLCPELSIIKDQLKALGFNSVTMTGSGSAFFCFGDVNAPSLPDVMFYPCKFISRQINSWYTKKT